MAIAPPEKTWLLHRLVVTFHRSYYTRNHAQMITGVMRVLCKPVHLTEIMRQYKDIASYIVVQVTDETTGTDYPQFRTTIIQNEGE